MSVFSNEELENSVLEIWITSSTLWFSPRAFEKKEVLLEVFEAVDQGIKFH